jgi:plastocyanin
MFRLKPIRAFALLLVTAACSDAVSPSSSDLAASPALGTGGVTFDQFISQVSRLGRAPEWRFAPEHLYLREGDEYMATNVGGEVHTFTEVEEFGGGIVQPLNDLLGLTTVAPECQTLGQSDFVAPGESTDADEPEEVGDEHYQCCIHPWMRMTVHVRER